MIECNCSHLPRATCSPRHFDCCPLYVRPERCPHSVVVSSPPNGPVRIAFLAFLKQRGFEKTMVAAAQRVELGFYWFPPMPFYEEAQPLANELSGMGLEVELKA